MKQKNLQYQHKCKNIEVVFNKDWFEESPKCPHGPMLLFEELVVSSKGINNTKRYYACAASRDRKFCPCYIKEADFKKNKKVFKQDLCNPCLPSYLDVHSLNEKYFCYKSQKFILNFNAITYPNNSHIKRLNETEMLNPSKTFIKASQDNKFKAQFFLKNKCLEFLLNEIQRLGYSHVLCMGMPRLHEAIQTLKNPSLIDSYFLDIDDRYSMFWSSNKFSKFNMFNHYFFNETDKPMLQKFMKSSKQLLLVTDPPFGGLVECLKNTFSWFNDINKCETMLIFPYFNHSKIKEVLPDFNMCDYVIEYDNHKKYKEKSSPVRIFTNIDLKLIKLPLDEGYKFCKYCEKYGLKENLHCSICNTCPSLNGKTYVHCFKCEKCVKPGLKHCNSCNRCQPVKGHQCRGIIKNKCHICGSENHKRRNCPERHNIPPVKKIKLDN